MADLTSLELLTGEKALSDMTDDELREHLRQIRQLRITPRAKGGMTKASKGQAKSRTTQSPFDALLRSLGPEALEEMAKMFAEKETKDEQNS